MTTALLVSADAVLLDEVTRLAAAAGVPLTVTGDAAEAARWWSHVGVLVVGADLIEVLAGASLRRRSGVVVVAARPVGDAELRAALAIGAENVVELPAGGGQLGDLFADLDDDHGTGRTICVVGAVGGVGATTFAAALTQVAAGSAPSVVIDLDPLGPGADTVLGLERHRGIRWPDLTSSSGRLGARALRDSLPREDGAAALAFGPDPAGPPDTATTREVLAAAARGHGVVVVDLPRHRADSLLDVVAHCHAVVVLTRTDVMGVAAARRLATAAPEFARGGLVVRGSAVSAAHAASVAGLPLLARMRDEPRLVEAVDLGFGPVRRQRGPLARAAAAVLEAVA